jgi:hypothetical protein
LKLLIDEAVTGVSRVRQMFAGRQKCDSEETVTWQKRHY